MSKKSFLSPPFSSPGTKSIGTASLSERDAQFVFNYEEVKITRIAYGLAYGLNRIIYQ